MTGLVSEREAFERNGEEGKRELTTSHDCSLRVDSQRIFRLIRWHPYQRTSERQQFCLHESRYRRHVRKKVGKLNKLIKSCEPLISSALIAPLVITTPFPSVALTTSLAPLIQFLLLFPHSPPDSPS